MAIKINQKIKAYTVGKPDEPAAAAPARADATPERPKAEVIHMHEQIERPDVLVGSTYKIKSPLFEHALYVTMNDIVLNAGTEYESRRPFEIFINSKNMDHFQWIVALTRIMSAVFRKGGDVTFLVEEMKAVFDPRGGYFKSGGIYMPSIVAEIGAVVESHLKMIGMILDPEMTNETKALIAEKRAAYEAQQSKKKIAGSSGAKASGRSEGRGASDAPDAAIDDSASDQLGDEGSVSGDLGGAGAEDARKSGVEVIGTAQGQGEAIPGAVMCPKCYAKAVVVMDGCATCLSCGNSKCG